MQSRKHSAMETALNVATGYVLAVCGQMVLFPAFGIIVPTKSNFVIGLWFTVASIARSFTLRRIFSRWEGGA